uniref:Uncharacterized protein n=1 Tax=Cacopsylla melanoneura TaxID=428564 RepID=A0A8D8PUT0_9HEMI
MISMAGITVSSSWTCDNLLACFTIGTNHEPSIMDDIVEQDKCICLTCTEDLSNNPCTIDIIADRNSGMAFKTVHVVSQSRLLEVFGNHGEYLSTFPGELFDEFEDTCIYTTKIKLRSPLTTLSIKFTRLKDKEFWIYGIYLTKINVSSQSSRSIQQPGDQQNTNSQHAMNNMPPPSLMQFQNLLQMTSNEELLSNLLSTFGSSVSKDVKGNVCSTDKSFVNAEKSNVCSTDTSFVNAEKLSEPPSVEKVSMKDIECVIDKELRNMERKILNHVDARFDALHNKMDLMFAKLEMLYHNNNLKGTEENTNNGNNNLKETEENTNNGPHVCQARNAVSQ